MRFFFPLIKLEDIKRLVIPSLDGVKKQTLPYNVVGNVISKIILEGCLAMCFKFLKESIDPEKSTFRN